MTSINTNFAAMTALQSLNQTNKSMLETQTRISTGYRVGQASDNAAYWSMATTMRADNKSLSAVSSALGLGSATVDVAYVAMEKSIDVMTDLQQKLVLARQPGADRVKIQTEIDELQNQLRSISSSASFSGENWLSVDTTAGSGYSATESVVASFSRTSTSVSVGTISVDVASSYLFNRNAAATADARGILASSRVAATGAIGAAGTIVVASQSGTAEMDISGAAVTDANIDEFIRAVDEALSEMTDAATNLGSAKSRIDMQSDFINSLSDAIERGISTLVDADMSEESTRMQALQVQQQLGIQALSMANQNSQAILALFR